MRKISIVASRPRENHIGSALIMYFLKTNYSHVSWVFWSKDEKKPFYYESVLSGGVKFTGQMYWEHRNLNVFNADFWVEDSVFDSFLTLAMDRCGEEYGLLQNIGIQVSRWFKIARNVFSNGDDKSNCSELIFIFRDLVGLKIQVEQDLVTPKDCVEACLGISA